MNSNKPKDSIRIDLRPQTWQLTSIVVCCGLASFVACVLLVVAIFVFQYKDRQCKVSRKEERLLWRHNSCFDDEEIAHVRYDTQQMVEFEQIRYKKKEPFTNINEETRERYRKSSMILHLACCSFFSARAGS